VGRPACQRLQKCYCFLPQLHVLCVFEHAATRQKRF
jgi:hypothetical protein